MTNSLEQKYIDNTKEFDNKDFKQLLFDEDQTLFDLYKKLEGMSAALFLVSDLMSDKSGIKTRIKSLSLDLVTLGVQLRDKYSMSTEHFNKLRNSLLELTSLVDIAHIAGDISSMNTSVLKEEFGNLLRKMFEVKEKISIASRLSEYTSSESGGVDNGSTKPIISESHITSRGYSQNDNSEYKTVRISGRKEAREQSIINIVKDKKSVSIKDISKHIKGCSEKTIQRELISLVDKGVLRKEGERRWSRYSIAS